MEPTYKTYELLAKKNLLHIDLHKHRKEANIYLFFPTMIYLLWALIWNEIYGSMYT